MKLNVGDKFQRDDFSVIITGITKPNIWRVTVDILRENKKTTHHAFNIAFEPTRACAKFYVDKWVGEMLKLLE